jgi:peptidoglycan hydrolase-like protein with peptidoglycan-binding domain
MRLRNRTIKAALAALLSLGLVTVAAQPAMALTYQEPCVTYLYSGVAWQNTTSPTATGFYDKVVWCQIQAGPSHDMYNVNAPQGGGFVYNYIANGIPGANTWKGLQSYLAVNWQYAGPINGIPGPNTYNAIIRAGNSLAPLGVQPLDGSLSTTDWRNFAYHVKVVFYGL